MTNGHLADLPWRRDVLQKRVQCYRAAGDPKAAVAQEELAAFLRAEPLSFAERLPPAAAQNGAEDPAQDVLAQA